MGKLLVKVGARRKQKLVVVDLSQGRKSRRYNRGKLTEPRSRGLAGAPKIFFVKGVSV